MNVRPGRGLTVGQAALRATMAGGPVVALLATGAAGAWPAPWLVVTVGVVALGWAAFPESAAGTGAFLLVLAWWGIGLRDGLHPASLGAAAALLVAHLAGLVAALGPGTVGLDRAVLLLWARRGLLVLLAAPPVWALAEAVDGRPEPPGVWVAGLAAVLAAVLVANLRYVRRPSP